jgi:hypothetical protein
MPTNPQTIGDLISTVQTDTQTIESDRKALTDAQDKLNEDLKAQAENTKARDEAIAKAGGVFIVNEDGSATAYEPDGAGGVKTTLLKPATTPIDGSTPAPAPTPEPSPNPTPSPSPAPEPEPVTDPANAAPLP